MCAHTINAQSGNTFTSVIDSELYQKVEKEITIIVKKDKMKLVTVRVCVRVCVCVCVCACVCGRTQHHE